MDEPAKRLLEAAKNLMPGLTGYIDWRRAVMFEQAYDEAPYSELARAIMDCLPDDEAERIRQDFLKWRETSGLYT